MNRQMLEQLDSLTSQIQLTLATMPEQDEHTKLLKSQYQKLSSIVLDIKVQETPKPKRPISSYIPSFVKSWEFYKTALLLGIILVNLLPKPSPLPNNPTIPQAVYIVDNPNPNPIPPNPNPIPPNPNPIPPNPIPKIIGKLYAIQVFNSSSNSSSTQAAMAVAGDPNLEPQLLALDVHWRHWDSEEPLIDSQQLRKYLPDPATLPVLLIYDDKGQFYDLKGNPLPRDKPVYQQPPKTSQAMIDTFKTIRAI